MASTVRQILAFILLPVLFSNVESGEYDLTIEVAPGKYQCFFQPVTEKHKTLEIDYQVIFLKLFLN